MEISENHQLLFDGVSAEEIANTYGTPTYIYEENTIRQRYRQALKAFRGQFERFRFFYAIKANSNPAIARILLEEGAGIDAASANEIRLAASLGVAGKDIIYSGNFLSDEDLNVGLENQVIVNLDDIALLPRMLKFGKPEVLSFRINPGYGRSDVGDFVTNAGENAKFGIHPDAVEEAYALAKEAGIKRLGVHMMPGSCIRDPGYFSYITELLMNLVGPVVKKLDLELEFVDIGGGLGVPYAPGEHGLDIEATAAVVARMFRRKIEEYDLGNPWLYMEPARYFVAEAGYLLGQVHLIKNGYTDIVGTDVGMNIMARPALYGAYHHIYVDGREHEPRKPTNLCGQICENTDYWVRDRHLPQGLTVGDRIAVANAGAYGYCMSYGYNGRLRPAEVLVKDGKHFLIRRRETYEDAISGTSMPDHIKG